MTPQLHALEPFPAPDPPMESHDDVRFRTLADISDDPPGDLLLGIAEDGPTLLYASGGTGKGTTGSWMIRDLVALGMRPMIYDAENRPKEWARRTSGLGVDRGQVIYMQPKDLPKALLGRPAWDIAPYLGRVLNAGRGDVLFVDSILPAVGVGEERLRSDAQAPYLYVAAFDALGKPSISFGHPPKGQPEGEPFGSMAWVAAMRLTWLGTRAEGDGHTVRWRPRKRNERGHIPGLLLTFLYDGLRLVDVQREDDEESTRERLLYMLKDGPRTIADMASELLDELEEHVTEEMRDRTKERLGKALNRMKRDGSVEKQGTTRNATWSLRRES